MLRVTVSGSFRRHMTAIRTAVEELTELGVDVLSPADPRIVDQIGEFVFVASDRVRSVKMVQDRHLECIRASDFLWLVAPDGYVGQSASMELGFAVANNVPIFSQVLPTDGTLQRYVRWLPQIGAALPIAFASRCASKGDSWLLDPAAGTATAHDRLEILHSRLTGLGSEVWDAEGDVILAERNSLAEFIAPSGSPAGRRSAALP